MFIVTSIHKGFPNSEFLEELVAFNNDIVIDLSTTGIIDKIEVIGKRQCRNPTKENWFLQAPPAITKWFIRKEVINFDLIKVYVQEHLNLAFCFNCSAFSHVAKQKRIVTDVEAIIAEMTVVRRNCLAQTVSNLTNETQSL